MIEITITTKAGKFVMKGEEFVGGFVEYNAKESGFDFRNRERIAELFAGFLSTYEQEVKTEKKCESCLVGFGKEDIMGRCTCL